MEGRNTGFQGFSQLQNSPQRYLTTVSLLQPHTDQTNTHTSNLHKPRVIQMYLYKANSCLLL